MNIQTLCPVQRNTDIQSTRCTTVTFEKLQGDSYIQGDRYIQVNFAENIRKLKILGSCLVTGTYRAFVYRFDCISLTKNRFSPSGWSIS